MRTLGTIVKWAILLPILLAVVLLAIANDQSVQVHLNPFDKADPVLVFELALYQFAFLMFVLGVVAGGLIAWSRRLRSRPRHDFQPAAAQTRAEWVDRHPAEPGSTGAAAFLPRPGRS